MSRPQSAHLDASYVVWRGRHAPRSAVGLEMSDFARRTGGGAQHDLKMLIGPESSLCTPHRHANWPPLRLARCASSANP